MNSLWSTIVRESLAWLGGWVRGWDRFWFEARKPHTVCLLRVLSGGMLFYTHLIWTLRLDEFLGPNAWLPGPVIHAELDSMGVWTQWSHWHWIQSPAAMWTVHLAALAVFFLFAIGAWTRVTSVLAWLLTVSYCNRLYGSLFGLDQINTMLSMYLMLAPCGELYSWDAWRRRRQGAPTGRASSWTTIATRLIQLHLCLIYLFGGIGKMRGATWWNGTAMWFALANQEYQSLDMTWLAPAWPIINGLTHLTVFWEVSYPALVWSRRTRPIALACAVLVHGGIAACMGMATFGVIMIVANMSFIPPSWIERLTSWRSPRGPSPRDR